MISIRVAKIAVVFCCSWIAGLPGINNLLDYNVNLQFVQHVFMMDSLAFEPSVVSWRSIHSPIIHHLAYLFLIFTELSIFVLGLWGSHDLWKARYDAVLFNRRKSKAVWAMLLGIFLWILAFMVVGGEWFLMWLSEDWNAVQSAFRYSVPFLFGLVLLTIEDKEF